MSQDQTTDIAKARETAKGLTIWALGAPRVAGDVMQEAAACILVLAAEIERLRAALRVIAGEALASDNLLGNADIARMALHGR